MMLQRLLQSLQRVKSSSGMIPGGNVQVVVGKQSFDKQKARLITLRPSFRI